MARDLTPPLADRIGEWRTPRPCPLDVLIGPDPSRALRLAYAMACGYRDLAQAAFQRIADQQTEIARQRERIAAVIDEMRAQRGRAA